MPPARSWPDVATCPAKRHAVRLSGYRPRPSACDPEAVAQGVGHGPSGAPTARGSPFSTEHSLRAERILLWEADIGSCALIPQVSGEGAETRPCPQRGVDRHRWYVRR